MANKKDLNSKVRKAIIHIMDEREITQVDLGRRLGCTAQTVNGMLSQGHNFTLNTVMRVEKVLRRKILDAVYEAA